MIRFRIRDLRTPAGVKLHVAQVQQFRPAELADVIRRMGSISSTVSKADIAAVLEDYFSTIEAMVLEGFSVNTPHTNYRVSIQGTFAGAADGFDPSRHRVTACVSPGKRLKKVVRAGAQVELNGRLWRLPEPTTYFDVESGQPDSALTPGGPGRLKGRNLAFDAADPKQGVFFLDGAGSATRVLKIGKNVPGELFFTVPALAAGTYTLEVRAGYNDAGNVHTGVLPATLTVA